MGAENPVTSRDLHILVYEASESISSERPGSGTGAWGSGTRGRPLMQRSVRTMSVVMLGELLQHLREVAVWVPRTRSRHAACTYS